MIPKLLPSLTLCTAFAFTACSSNSNDDAADSGSTPIIPPVEAPVTSDAIVLGDRPAELVAQLADSDLKRRLQACNTTNAQPDRFSIAHRGAPLRIPEHSREGYLAAVRQGAGIVECDVTFTADAEPVCRHSQCDLHTTTDILATDLAARCSVPPDPDATSPFAEVSCCTSDLTLAEFRTLRAKRDGADNDAPTTADYLAGTPGWTGDAATDYATLMSLDDAVALLEPLGVAMTPELKEFDAPPGDAARFSREALSRRMFDTFRAAGLSADRLYPQSFELDDIALWQRIEPAYAVQSLWLDGRYQTENIDVDDASSLEPGFDELQAAGVRYLAPPIWMLLTLDEQGEIVPSDYARRAREAGLPLLTWSLERGVDVANGGGWYYQSIAPAFTTEADQLRVLEVLQNDVGVEGVFSDWPATTSFFANCDGE